MRAARWKTRSCPRMAVRTPLGSRTSPMKMSISLRISGGRVSIQPSEPKELYRQNARTFSPRLTSSSVRWLPIKPSAPVTITECAIVCSFIQGDSAPYFTLLQNSITDFGEDFNCKLRIVNGRLRGKPLRPRRLGQLPAQRGAFSRGLRPRKRPPLSGEVAERQRWPEGLWSCLLQRIIQNLRQKIPTTLLTCGKFRVTI